MYVNYYKTMNMNASFITFSIIFLLLKLYSLLLSFTQNFFYKKKKYCASNSSRHHNYTI